MVTVLAINEDYIPMLFQEQRKTYTNDDLEALDLFELECDGADTVTLARWHDVNMGPPTLRNIEDILEADGYSLEDFKADNADGAYTWVGLYQWMGY